MKNNTQRLIIPLVFIILLFLYCGDKGSPTDSGNNKISEIVNKIAVNNIDAGLYEDYALAIIDPETKNIIKVGKEMDTDNFAWTPDGSKIYFTAESDNYIYSVDFDGNNLIKTNIIGRIVSLSPNGKKILYYNKTDYNYYISNIDGSSAKRLPGGWPVQWSPNNDEILINRDWQSDDFITYNIISEKTKSYHANRSLDNENRCYAGGYFLDGQKIFYLEMPTRNPNTRGWFSINLTGSEKQMIDSGIKSDYIYPSPNSQHFFIAEGPYDSDGIALFDLYVCEINGNNKQNTDKKAFIQANYTVSCNNISWSPDSKNLCYLTQNKIEIYNLDKNSSEKLVDFGDYYAIIKWSPK